MISGWLFDVYPHDSKIVFWIKQENGNTIRLEDRSWSHSIYVASDDNLYLKSVIDCIVDGSNVEKNNITSLVKDYEFISKYEKITDVTKSKVLKLMLADSRKALTLARRIEMLGNDSDNGSNSKFGKYRIYNVDLLPAQSYFYEHDIFPLAFCEVINYYNNNHCSKKLRWLKKDSVWSTDYKISDFKAIHLTLNLRKEAKIPRYTDKIDSIRIVQEQLRGGGRGEEKHGEQSFEIQSKSEAEVIQELVKTIKKMDPDFIFTEDGDSFTFPCLVHRAKRNDVHLILGREPTIPIKKPIKQGTSYFSYGKIYFKPTTINLLGRIHIDKDNSFIYNDSGLQGLYEVARICRMPLHTAARASIGKCLSSLQFYYAAQKGILVPSKPIIAEHFKSTGELLVAEP